jgi:hypothetical protein
VDSLSAIEPCVVDQIGNLTQRFRRIGDPQRLSSKRKSVGSRMLLLPQSSSLGGQIAQPPTRYSEGASACSPIATHT